MSQISQNTRSTLLAYASCGPIILRTTPTGFELLTPAGREEHRSEERALGAFEAAVRAAERDTEGPRKPRTVTR